MASKLIALSELEQHNTVEDNWIAVHGNVYDLTTFANDHPGGVDVLLENAGADGTEAYEYAGHSENAKVTLQKYLLGRLEGYAAPVEELSHLSSSVKPKKTLAGLLNSSSSIFSVPRSKPLISEDLARIISAGTFVGFLGFFGRLMLRQWVQRPTLGEVFGVGDLARAFWMAILMSSCIIGGAMVYLYHQLSKTLVHTKEPFAYPAIIPRKKLGTAEQAL